MYLYCFLICILHFDVCFLIWQCKTLLKLSLHCWCCSVAKSCPTLCNPMNCSTPGSSVLHYLPECAQTRGHWVRAAIQPSHPLLSPSPPAFSLSQHQGLSPWVSSLYQMAKQLELQLQYQSFKCYYYAFWPSSLFFPPPPSASESH